MDKLKPYLPFALRLLATLVAALAVLAAARWNLAPDHLSEAIGAAALAWARWHPSASLKAVFLNLGIEVEDPPELPVDSPANGTGDRP